MDFKIKHKDSAKAVLEEIFASRKALDLLLKTGKAIELDFSDLEHSPSRTVEIDSHRLSFAKILRLIEAARKAREFSYAPYSHFNVGAAIFAADQNGKTKIFEGCNVENAAYGSTICAERTAALIAISRGFRTFSAYAVVGGFDDSVSEEQKQAAQKEHITPCGSCRQVTKEFEANFCFVIMAKDTGRVYITTMEYILPGGFGPRNLGIDASTYSRHAGH